MKNTFGNNISITLFGESHGEAIGCVLDGIAPGIEVDEEFIASQMEKRKALKAKTGFDVDAALRHIEEEKEDNGQNTILKTTERRVKPDAAPAGRRTAPPQYNIIKKAEEAPATDAE